MTFPDFPCCFLTIQALSFNIEMSLLIDGPVSFRGAALDTTVKGVPFKHVEQNNDQDHQNWDHQKKEDQKTISERII